MATSRSMSQLGQRLVAARGIRLQQVQQPQIGLVDGDLLHS
jgi:hypothetical protein